MLKKLPLSGSESLFSDLVYGTHQGITNNNCYAWAIDAYRGSGNVKLQPGNLSGQTSNRDSSSCAFLRDRALDDNRRRGMYSVAPTKRCRKGFYKIMAFIDKGKDYHWYKQHRHLLYRVGKGETPRTVARDLGVPRKSVVAPTPRPMPGDLVFVRNAGVFSHKQGFATGPLLRDAGNKIIPDPRRANKNYGAYNYKTFCGSMCVRNVKPTIAPTQPEAAHLHTLLHKRVHLLNSGVKQPNQLVARRPKVQGRNRRKV